MLRTLPALLTAITIVAVSTEQPFQAARPDLSGTWAGKVIIQKENAPPLEEGLHAVLSQSGTEITGTVGPAADRQFKIVSGKIELIEGITTVTFETGRQGGRKIFAAKLIDDALKGTLTELEPKATFQFELKRSK